MIARSYILANITTLDRKYQRATSVKESLFYSKLAILELCGWIEESMDDIVRGCAKRHLTEQVNIVFIEKHVIKQTHGFNYQTNFRKMLIQLIGIINIEKVEKSLDQGKLTRFTAALDSLKIDRNTEAHTHIKGVTRHINAPSVTLAQFPALYEGLIEFHGALRRMTL